MNYEQRSSASISAERHEVGDPLSQHELVDVEHDGEILLQLSILATREKRAVVAKRFLNFR